MFSGRAPVSVEPMADGTYFIDRDGEHFKHILQYLRRGFVAVEPGSEKCRELAVEAEYYEITDLVRLLRAKPFDYPGYLGEDVAQMQEREAELRARLASSEGAAPDSHAGLVSIFDNAALLRDANEWCPDPMKHPTLLERSEGVDHAKPAVVTTLKQFRTNFAEAHSNLLERLDPILQSEPVLIAGGSVLHALTMGCRLGHLYTGKTDIDVFVCTDSAVNATRICRRIYYALAADDECWTISRGSGVVNIERFDEDDDDDDNEHEYVEPPPWQPTETNMTAHSVVHQVQVILRLYASPAEVLLGFDCDCACVGFDGSRVFALPRALRAIKHGVNILNPLHAWPIRAAYELRLCK
jgi:hypothetical protein